MADNSIRQAVLDLVEAVDKVVNGQADSRSLFQILATVAATHAVQAGVCEHHFVEFARAVHQKAQQPAVVACTNCGVQNRVTRNDPLRAICGSCKAPLFPALVELASTPSTPTN